MPEQRPQVFEIFELWPGDILFVYENSNNKGERFGRFLNTSGQRLLAASRKRNRIPAWARLPKYSHVILGLQQGLAIHADGTKVRVELLSDAIDQIFAGNTSFKAYRHKLISEQRRQQIAAAALRYHNINYGFSGYFARQKNESPTMFCSQLIAYAYRAAKLPLTRQLTDNKVLPIDLYAICQQSDWRDITGDLVQQAPAMADEIFPKINIPGMGELAFSEFWDHTTRTLTDAAANSQKFLDLRYKTIIDWVTAQGEIAKFVVAKYALARSSYAAPEGMGEAGARTIVRILEQIDSLLSLSQLPTIDLILTPLKLELFEELPGTSAYVGLPTAGEMREFQRLCEIIRLRASFLFGEIGLFAIIAKAMPHDNVARFRAVKSQYVERFIAALPQELPNLDQYKTDENTFQWISQEDERTATQNTFKNILVGIEVIGMIRKLDGAKSAPTGSGQHRSD